MAKGRRPLCRRPFHVEAATFCDLFASANHISRPISAINRIVLGPITSTKPAVLAPNTNVSLAPAADIREEAIGLILHKDGIVVDLNEQTAAMFGFTRNQLIGRALTDFLVLSASDTEPAEARVLTESGERRLFEILTGRR